MSKRKLTLSNFQGTGSISVGRVSVCCEDQYGLRYHAWYNTVVGKFLDDVLYKNPPLSLRRGESGHFNTRHLSLEKNPVIRDALLAHVPQAVEQATRTASVYEEERRARVEAEGARHRLREAAPNLLAVLKALTEELIAGGWVENEQSAAKRVQRDAVLCPALKAIEEAEGRAK